MSAAIKVARRDGCVELTVEGARQRVRLKLTEERARALGLELLDASGGGDASFEGFFREMLKRGKR